jgi:dTDP-4-amino-4,6-dideoxy-D-galactose acyltransferase
VGVFREARRAAIECLYLEVAVSSRASLLAGSHGLRLVDVRLLLDRDLDIVKPLSKAVSAVEVGPPRVEDAAELERIAEKGSRVSRYYRDPAFRRHSGRLYRRWIAESCRGWADVVLVARRCGQPVGFITCKLPKASPGCGRIDLVCVEPTHAGHGIGSILVGASLEWFVGQDLRSVEVVTQAHNTTAVRLYERMGFRVRRVSLFYHGWMPRQRHRN